MSIEDPVHIRWVNYLTALDWQLEGAAQVAERCMAEGDPDRELIVRLRDAVQNAGEAHEQLIMRLEAEAREAVKS